MTFTICLKYCTWRVMKKGKKGKNSLNVKAKVKLIATSIHESLWLKLFSRHVAHNLTKGAADYRHLLAKELVLYP